MRTFLNLLFGVVLLFMYSCGSGISENYHIEKPIWDVDDYALAIEEIKLSQVNEAEIPTISNPELAQVFHKLTDKNNLFLVLEDKELGLKHRSEISSRFFNFGQDIMGIYGELDVQDKYVHPKEYILAIDFFLTAQRLHFKIGNENIKKQTVDFENYIKSNEATVVNNFENYISFLINEEAFDSESRKELALMLDAQVKDLITTFPTYSDAYLDLRNSAETVKLKVKSIELQNSLTNLIVSVDKLIGLKDTASVIE